MPFNPSSAAHGVATQIGPFDFGNNTIQKFIRGIIQAGIIAVFQLDKIMSQIIQVFMVNKDAGDRQNGLMIAVGSRINGKRSQIAGFVNVTDFDQNTSDTTKVTEW